MNIENRVEKQIAADNAFINAEFKRLEEAGDKIFADIDRKILNENLMMMCQ